MSEPSTKKCSWSGRHLFLNGSNCKIHQISLCLGLCVERVQVVTPTWFDDDLSTLSCLTGVEEVGRGARNATCQVLRFPKFPEDHFHQDGLPSPLDSLKIPPRLYSWPPPILSPYYACWLSPPSCGELPMVSYMHICHSPYSSLIIHPSAISCENLNRRKTSCSSLWFHTAEEHQRCPWGKDMLKTNWKLEF